VVIACDTRHASQDLAVVCAEVTAAAGLTALIYESFRPTPELSFTVRLHHTSAGIVISASHNPRTDNGFKAYGPDGGQLVPPYDAEVLEAVERTMSQEIPRLPLEEGLQDGRIRWLGETEDDAYRKAVLKTSHSEHREARIVYTPLHGAGIRSVPPVLEAAGFHDVHLVAEQAEPNGDFPNVFNNIPNPEEPEALNEAARLAVQLDADVAIGSDPDADRLGCVARRAKPEPRWERLTGNQIGAILCDYVLGAMDAGGQLLPKHLVLTTTVTSRMIGKIAARHGVGVIEDLLVGFKYIACVMEELGDPHRVVFACEESHGYLGGSYTRDKDASCAALLLSEAVACARLDGEDLWDRLEEVYDAVGYHCDLMFPYFSPGKSGLAHIDRMLAGLRLQPPKHLAGLPVTRITDRLANTIRDAQGVLIGEFSPLRDPHTEAVLRGLLPAKDNLLVFEIGGDGPLAGARAAVRPSGTEPKCKFYASGWSEPHRCDPSVRSAVDSLTARIRDDLYQYALQLAGEA